MPLIHLNNFWRTLDRPLMNREINLNLTWSENSVTSKATRYDVTTQGRNPTVAAIDNPTNATFKITDTKLHVPVVTLSTENDKNFIEQLRTGFERTIKWNKYRSGKTKNFTKAKRLFVLSFKNKNDSTTFPKYYVPNM